MYQLEIAGVVVRIFRAGRRGVEYLISDPAQSTLSSCERRPVVHWNAGHRAGDVDAIGFLIHFSPSSIMCFLFPSCTHPHSYITKRHIRISSRRRKATTDMP